MKDILNNKSHFFIDFIVLLITTISTIKGMLEWKALLIIITYVSLIVFFTFSKYKNIKPIIATIIIIISLALISHRLPGFHNIPIYDAIKLESNSSPFSMWLSFDKAYIPLLFIYYFNQHNKKLGLQKSLYKTSIIAVCAILTLLIPAFLVHYIQFSPKIPAILPMWLAFQVLVVLCEEGFFRGFLQNYLQDALKNIKYGAVIGLLIANIPFAAIHYHGGMIYVFLSFIAGLFYGLAFMLTKRVEASMIVHFSVNLTHILLFSYPSLAYSM